MYVWAYKCSIVGLVYRGGALDGPNLRKLLRNLDSLQDFVDVKFHNYVVCLRLFDKVAKACFGMILKSDWEDTIEQFKISYRNLGESVTPKAHTVFFEIPKFIRRHNKPMGYFSEGKFEHVHQV